MTFGPLRSALGLLLDIAVGYVPTSTEIFSCGCIVTISQSHAGHKLRFDSYPVSSCTKSNHYSVSILHAPTDDTSGNADSAQASASAGYSYDGCNSSRP